MKRNSVSVSVTITLNVHDQREFRETAYQQALQVGLSPADAKVYKNPRRKSLGECAGMILDPGISPDGCDIIGSDWDEGGVEC